MADSAVATKGLVPVKYFIDTEFFERPGRIDLISIGIVAEDDREFYAENAEFDWSFGELRGLTKTIGGLAGAGDPKMETPHWLIKNVKPYLRGHLMEVATIRESIRNFVWDEPEFWGYMSSYDWVVFCWIFGRMADKPDSFPYYCNDLAQLMNMIGVERQDLPPEEVGHHALRDARWLKKAYDRVKQLSADRAFAGIRSN